MRKEEKAQVKVAVGIEVLWRALTKDLSLVLPQAVPNLVKEIEILEGDGGLGTVMFLNFGTDVTHITYQKEKIVEFDESHHQIGMQVIEGGHLILGFSSYATYLQLTEIGKVETLVDIKVVNDSEADETNLPSKTTSSTLVFIKSLESYILKSNA